MSLYGESEAHSGRRVKIEEDWGDDVSIISRYEGSSVTTIILKFAIAALMIGACSGALVYSILNSEEQQKIEYEQTEDFPINTNQETTNGTMTLTYRTGRDLGDSSGYRTTTYGCNWVQDNDRKRLFHRVGLMADDWQYTYYVFQNITFYQTKRSCTMFSTGYNHFLSGFGLEYIQKRHVEELMIDGDYRETVVYEGEPPLDTTVHGEHPSLIRGYAASDAALTYGWQFYFARTSNVSLYKQEYFFPKMAHRQPDFAIFDNLPEQCLRKEQRKDV